MRVNITTRNFNASDQLKERIDKKFQRLDKYFSREIVAYVILSNEKSHLQKLEATINAGGMIFRAEEVNPDIYYCLDKVVDRLSSQMSRFKQKMVRRHKDQKEILFAALPDYDEPMSEIRIERTKRFAIQPMSTEEAVMQMELLGHSFFVFLNEDADSVRVVYRRRDGTYGLLIPEL